MADVTDRLELPFPTGDDLIADGDDAIQALAEKIDADHVVFMQGLFDARPESSVPNPGLRGRLYYATDKAELYYDHGAGWTAIQEIPDSGVTTAKLADGAVTSQKIADGGVATADLADNAVTEGKLASGAVTQPKIADGAVTQAKIADGAVTSGKLLANAVTSQKLADGAVTAQKVANALKPSQGAAAGTEALRALGTGAGQACAGNDPRLSDQRTPVDGSVTTQKLSNGAVTTGKLADGAVTEAKLGLRIIRGEVAADGNYTGTGFEVRKAFLPTGEFEVLFDDSFSQPPVVLMGCAAAGFAYPEQVSGDEFTARTDGPNESPQDLPFSFIAIGA